MTWDFVETSPRSEAAGDYATTVRNVVRVLESQPPTPQTGHAETASATRHPLPDDSAWALITDPPYYDAVPYALLQDGDILLAKRLAPLLQEAEELTAILVTCIKNAKQRKEP